MRTSFELGRAAFGLAVAGALGVGATQAVASPRTNAGTPAACNFTNCSIPCQELGYDGGRCLENGDCEGYLRSR